MPGRPDDLVEDSLRLRLLPQGQVGLAENRERPGQVLGLGLAALHHIFEIAVRGHRKLGVGQEGLLVSLVLCGLRGLPEIQAEFLDKVALRRVALALLHDRGEIAIDVVIAPELA